MGKPLSDRYNKHLCKLHVIYLQVVIGGLNFYAPPNGAGKIFSNLWQGFLGKVPASKGSILSSLKLVFCCVAVVKRFPVNHHKSGSSKCRLYIFLSFANESI